MADYKRRIVAEFSAQNKAKGQMAGFRGDMDRTGQAMKRMAGQALALAGVGGGLYALKRGFDYVTKAAMKQEDAVFLLAASLKATEDYSRAAMEQFEAFAASIQQATVYGDEEVLSLMQLMKSLGVASGSLEQATRMAIGLAAATGRDVRSMSMYIALAQQGEFTMLRRYIPALRSTTDATEQLRIITEFAANGFKIAEAQAETTSGSLDQMKNAASDLAEVIGQPFLDDMAKSANILKVALEGTTKATNDYRKSTKEVSELLGILKYIPVGALLAYPMLPKELLKKAKPSEPARPARPEYPMPEMTQRILEGGRKVIEMRRLQAEQTDAMMAHRKKMFEEGGTLEAMQWRLSTERIRMRMEMETAAREAAAAKALEIAERTAERRKRIAEDIAYSMASSWTSAMDRMMFEGQEFWDAMTDMARGLIRTIAQILIYKKLAEPMAYALMGQPVPAQYGGVFTQPTLVRAGEVPEAFVPLSGGRSIPVEMRGGGGETKTEVSIRNEGSEKLEIGSAAEYLLSDQRIIEVTLREMQTNTAYQRSIAQAAQG